VGMEFWLPGPSRPDIWTVHIGSLFEDLVRTIFHASPVKSRIRCGYLQKAHSINAGTVRKVTA
jgi:hypothetical protein